MAKDDKKPAGYDAFDSLTRKLIQVPRKELERKMAKRKIIKRKKR
jgi:hypothetical protein